VSASRWATALSVLAVAVIAAIVSYSHIQALALSHGCTPRTAGLLPFSVDGLIVASSLALANGARPSLARTGLVLGVLATVAANVAFGARFGLVGEIISAWPAGAFLIASEILLSMLRARPVADEAPASAAQADEDHAGEAGQALAREAGEDTPKPAAIAPATPVPPGTARTVAARTAPTKLRAKRKSAPDTVFAAELAAGTVPSIRAIKERCHVGTDSARVIREQLLALVGDGATPQAA
jgi:hypothetical protein